MNTLAIRILHDYVACERRRAPADRGRCRPEGGRCLSVSIPTVSGASRNAPNRSTPDRRVDRKLWRQAFDKTGLHALMDAEARRKFEDALEKKPLPFTIENVRGEFPPSPGSPTPCSRARLQRVPPALAVRLPRTSANPSDRAQCIRTGWFRPRWMKSGLEVKITTAPTGSTTSIASSRPFAGVPYIPRSLESALSAAMAGPICEMSLSDQGFPNGMRASSSGERTCWSG